jgi:hypothetical protein
MRIFAWVVLFHIGLCFAFQQCTLLQSRVSQQRLSPISCTSNVKKLTILEFDPPRRKSQELISFFKTNWLILGEVLVIAFAKWKPYFGATGGPLAPEVSNICSERNHDYSNFR